jgi:hypothetical protein
MWSRISRICLLLPVGLLAALPICAQDKSLLTSTYRSGDFKLVHAGKPASIVVSPEDFRVAQIAAANFAADVHLVSGVRPAVQASSTTGSSNAVLIGTLGKSSLIDSLVSSGKLDVTDLKGKWESFIIATVPNPLPGVGVGLVIAGSDRRGTAFGVYELSQAIGVSPWNWWADVKPRRNTELIVARGLRRFGPPSVKFRGIFLNDEDWGLQPWAAKTFEPEVGDIGPKTYAKIFELLLRLKANTVWPAMHACTKPFNAIPENRKVADDYGIVMGSSHAEPMLRNNVGEWKEKSEEYDYTKNPSGVTRYWEERVATNGSYENVYTLGMRGIHDSPIQGPKTQPERIALLEKIFALQRGMISKHVNADVDEVPQIFCPYKEVLTDYRAGLKVPDDVTIVFPDDNFGYIRYFPTAEERKRPGGFGVYYHISYLGRPLSYLWLNTTPPALIWEEMSKAYDHGMRQFWMLNVGDIKPAEIGIELFMQMGWDIQRWRRDNIDEFLATWARREFGPADANEIASIMSKYYELGFARKPEHLQWYLPTEKPRASDLTSVNFNDEVQTRLVTYLDIAGRAERLYKHDMTSAFYELVFYPVLTASLANHRYFLLEKSDLYARQGRASAIELSTRAEAAGKALAGLTDYFNGPRFMGGKWRHMVSMEMGPGQWPSMRTTVPVVPESVRTLRVSEEAGLGVAIEGRVEPVTAGAEASLPAMDSLTRDRRFIDVFNTGKKTAPWNATPAQSWIKVDRRSGDLSADTRIWVSVDWNRLPSQKILNGEIRIEGAGSHRTIRVTAVNTRPSQAEFVEVDGVVSIDAENFSRQRKRGEVSWNLIRGLGRSGNSVSIFPTTAASSDLNALSSSPSLEYDLDLSSAGAVTVTAYLVPNHPLQSGRGLRFAIGFDDDAPKVVTANAGMEVPSAVWSQNVLNNAAIAQTTLTVGPGNQHVLKLYMVDAGVVIDKIVVSATPVRPSYLGPPETRSRRLKRDR